MVIENIYCNGNDHPHKANRDLSPEVIASKNTLNKYHKNLDTILDQLDQNAKL